MLRGKKWEDIYLIFAVPIPTIVHWQNNSHEHDYVLNWRCWSQCHKQILQSEWLKRHMAWNTQFEFFLFYSSAQGEFIFWTFSTDWVPKEAADGQKFIVNFIWNPQSN